MSLWCGACRTEIYAGFGLLYRMEIVGGKPRLPTKDHEYVPPNSAVCTACWQGVPPAEAVDHPADAFVLQDGAAVVFAYAGADSSNSPIWGSKQWCDIDAGETYVFLRLGTVEEFMPKVLPIIAMDAKSKAESRAERGDDA